MVILNLYGYIMIGMKDNEVIIVFLILRESLFAVSHSQTYDHDSRFMVVSRDLRFLSAS